MRSELLSTDTILEDGVFDVDDAIDSGMPDEVSSSGCGVLTDATNVHHRQLVMKGKIKHPSIGSEKHFEGSCKRCCFFPRRRCTNGDKCEFCHYEHEKRTHKKRKAKSQFGDAEDKENMTVNVKGKSGAGIPACITIPQAFDTLSSKATSESSSPTAGLMPGKLQPQFSRRHYPESPAALPINMLQTHGQHHVDQWTANLDANRHAPCNDVPSAWAAEGHQWQGHGSEQLLATSDWGGSQAWTPTAQAGVEQPPWWNQAQTNHQQVVYGWSPQGQQQVQEHVLFDSATWPSYTDARVPESQPAMRPLPPGVSVAQDTKPPPMDPQWRAWPYIANMRPPGVQAAGHPQTSPMTSGSTPL